MLMRNLSISMLFYMNTINSFHNSTYTQKPIKVQIETAKPRRNFILVDNDKTRKTATEHSCKTLAK